MNFIVIDALRPFVILYLLIIVLPLFFPSFCLSFPSSFHPAVSIFPFGHSGIFSYTHPLNDSFILYSNDFCIHPFFCLFTPLSIILPIRLIFHSFILFVQQSICLVCLLSIHFCVCLFSYLFVILSIYLSLCLTIPSFLTVLSILPPVCFYLSVLRVYLDFVFVFGF